MAAKGKVELKNKLAKKLAARLKKTVKYVGYKWLLPVVYRWHSRKPINDRLVVFADLRDRDINVKSCRVDLFRTSCRIGNAEKRSCGSIFNL